MSQTSELTLAEEECLHQLKLLCAEDELITKSGFAEDDVILLAMVQGRKCDLDKAFATLKNYVNIRTVKYLKIYQNLNPSSFSYLFEPSFGPRFTGLLKHPDKKGRRVIVERAGFLNPDIHKPKDIIDRIAVSSEELLRRTNCPKQGIVVIIDGSGMGFKQAKEVTPSRLYLLSQLFISSNPCSVKGFHVVNNAFLLDAILTVAKQFLSKKLKERFHLHGTNHASLHEHFSKEYLPESLGGPLTDDEVFDVDYEKGIFENAEFYEKFGKNW